MGFANVDGQKSNVVLVIVVELRNVANLATEGRSSKAAEDEDKRPASGPFANVETRGSVKADKLGVWSLVTDLQVAAMHVRKGIADHVEGILRATGHNAEEHVDGDEKYRQ
jgi:hypothetical protein